MVLATLTQNPKRMPLTKWRQRISSLSKRSKLFTEDLLCSKVDSARETQDRALYMMAFTHDQDIDPSELLFKLVIFGGLFIGFWVAILLIITL